MDENNPQISPTTREHVEQMASQSEAQLQELLNTPRPLFFRVGETWAPFWTFGTPKWNVLPHNVQYLAKEIGFQPVCSSLSWILPVMLMRVAFWIGPEGFVLLSGVGGRFGIDVMMSDGRNIAILASGKELHGPRTRLVSCGDFNKDYAKILEVVHQHTLDTGATPIAVTNPRAVKLVHRAFVHLHRTTKTMLVMMIGQLMIFGMMISWIILITR